MRARLQAEQAWGDHSPMDKALGTALKIVLAYALVGVCWISFSDQALEQIGPSSTSDLTRLQSYKGWGFVGVTSLALFALSYFYLRRITRLQELDPLTKLLRHGLFLNYLETALKRELREGRQVLVMYLDIDHFSDLVAEVGTEATSRFLAQLGDDLRRSHSADSLLSRLGSNEFAFAIPLRGTTERDRRLLPLQLQGLFRATARQMGIGATCSIGAAIAPDDGTDADRLVSGAGNAMRATRAAGPGQIAYFNEAIARREREGRALLADLKRAVGNGDLTVLYQPQLRLTDRAVTGCEVLVRWTCPGRGEVAPSQFIPLAEQSQLISAVTEAVMATADRELRSEGLLGTALSRVSINISAPEFAEPGFRFWMERRLQGLEALRPYLQLEITERAALNDIVTTLSHITELREQGLRFSIDDFGTGYSGLAMLRDLPVDELKIDRSFVSEMENQQRPAAIVRAITGLARSFQLTVVAEGVETDGQLRALLECGCYEGQGWLFAPPMPAADLAAFVARHPTPVSSPAG